MSETAVFGPDDILEINPMYFLRWEEAQQAHVLLYPEGIVKLNETAGAILSRCTGETSVRELIDGLKRQYTEGNVEDGVRKFLEESHSKGWIRRKA